MVIRGGSCGQDHFGSVNFYSLPSHARFWKICRFRIVGDLLGG